MIFIFLIILVEGSVEYESDQIEKDIFLFNNETFVVCPHKYEYAYFIYNSSLKVEFYQTECAGRKRIENEKRINCGSYYCKYQLIYDCLRVKTQFNPNSVYVKFDY